MTKEYTSPGQIINADVSAYYPANTRMQGGYKTFNGNPVGRGRIAVDPDTIPFGSKVFIPGYGWAIADDTGGAIKGNRIDLGYGRNEGKAALAYGRQKHQIHVYPPDTDLMGAKDPAQLEEFMRNKYNFDTVIKPIPVKPIEKAMNQQFAPSAISNKSALGSMMVNSQSGMFPEANNAVSMQQLMKMYGKQ
jgi:3D (Asp-Asp-Asp) domain-containing protein